MITKKSFLVNIQGFKDLKIKIYDNIEIASKQAQHFTRVSNFALITNYHPRAFTMARQVWRKFLVLSEYRTQYFLPLFNCGSQLLNTHILSTPYLEKIRNFCM